MKSEFEFMITIQNTKVIFQKYIITKPNATRNIDNDVKTTAVNDSSKYYLNLKYFNIYLLCVTSIHF